MTEPHDDPLADDALLSAFLDTLIPPGGAMPGAGSLDMADGVRQQVKGNAMLEAPVRTALAALRDAALERDPGGLPALDLATREELLKGLMKQQPVLGMFQMGVFAAYYQHPEPRKALGHAGGAPFPDGYTVEPTDPELLDKLHARKRAD